MFKDIDLQFNMALHRRLQLSTKPTFWNETYSKWMKLHKEWHWG